MIASLQLAPLYTVECAEILKLLCAALCDDLHLLLECEALGVPNNISHGRKISNGVTNCPSMWMENNIDAYLV